MAIAWNESVNGDLSNDPGAPTPVMFELGGDIVIGSVGAPEDTRDFLTFTVEPNQRFVSLSLLSYSFDNGDLVAFHALNEGPTSYIPDVDTADNFLGGNHLEFSDSGRDLLPDLAMAPLAGTGFDVPLGPGTYSYVIQQTGMDHRLHARIQHRPGSRASRHFPVWSGARLAGLFSSALRLAERATVAPPGLKLPAAQPGDHQQ